MADDAASFEAMPLELHVNVLSHMSAPECVLATIRASPAALNALSTARERIYAVVLENCLAPEVYRELLAIMNAPDHNECPNVGTPHESKELDENIDSTITEWNAWTERVLTFLDRHVHGAVYSTPDPKMSAVEFNTQIKFTIRFYFCLSNLVNFYPTFAQSNAARIPLPVNELGMQVSGRQASLRLTGTELLRLQRGLIRYELYCRLIGMPSLAANCDRDSCADMLVFRSHELSSSLWWGTYFSETLPKDEVEEVICACIYVCDLYCSLRWSLLEDLHDHILDLNQGLDEAVLEKDPSNAGKKTAKHWLSRNEGEILHFGSLEHYDTGSWTDNMSRLGFVFLDRMARSTPTDRREIMRSAFTIFPVPGAVHNGGFLGLYWHQVVYGGRTPQADELGVGPHCNALTHVSIINDLVVDLISMSDTHQHLRRLGWVFFDDKANLRALGLPQDAEASTIGKWVHKAEKESGNWAPIIPKVSENVLAARFTEVEWKELVMAKYAPKDYRRDYQATSQFIAGARAVIAFASNRLPSFG